MYVTRLDYKAETLSKSLFNHKKFRPKIVYDNVEMYHLLIPDVELYIFNFIFDSKQYNINPQLYDIDIICQNTYDDLYAYPLVVFINGYAGLHKLQNANVFIPNHLIEFANKYGMKYKNYKEESLSDTGLKEAESYNANTSSSLSNKVASKFGQLFVEA